MKLNIKRPAILECTLRDGSYAIEYQFTAEDTAIISAGLERAGFELIEIGHGLGFNASSYGIAAAKDEEYLEAASAVLKKAKFGMFFIPGIGRMEDLDLAAKYKMNFVRIGTNVTEIEQAEPYIKRAKDLGIFVFSNLMKSYALPVDEFMKKAKMAAGYGADVISVVDSAGGMMPAEVRNYVSRIKSDIGIKVGFHAHNNLLLAVANTIEAVEAGADIIDTSLQGMGRSAGNAQTEVLVILLEKLGHRTGIDLYRTMDLGEKVVRPMMGGEKGMDSISATLGYAQFHSSYLKIIYKIAKKYNLDPRELVVKVSEIEKVKVTEELADKIAHEFKKEKKENIQEELSWNINFDFKKIIRLHPEGKIEEIAKSIALEMLSLSKKTGKPTVFTIAGSLNKNKKEASFPFIRQNAVYIIGNAEVANLDEAVRIAQAIDGQVDYILVDVGLYMHLYEKANKKIKTIIKHSEVLTYNDSDAQVNAVDALASQLLDEFGNKNVMIFGRNSMAEKLAIKLSERGASVAFTTDNSEAAESVDLLIGISPFKPIVDSIALKCLKKQGKIIDAGPGSILPDAISEAHKIGFPIYRIDMRAGLSGEIINVLETHELKNKIIGQRKIAGVQVVAGGILGKKGDVVVDSIVNPTRIIGIADGKGQLLDENSIVQYIDNVKKVKLEIAKNRFL